MRLFRVRTFDRLDDRTSQTQSRQLALSLFPRRTFGSLSAQTSITHPVHWGSAAFLGHQINAKSTYRTRSTSSTTATQGI
ncbi:MAG: hypothetical protein SWY16_02260 [Cyanobacteriota bacterium]|nr:hypothetical protein [Cyanobacteriota bacterium]